MIIKPTSDKKLGFCLIPDEICGITLGHNTLATNKINKSLIAITNVKNLR